MRLSTLTATALSGLLLAGASLSATAKTDLDGAAIQLLHQDSEINAVTHTGRAFTAKFYGNGRMDGVVAGDATNVDTGTWKVDGNRLCWKWFKWDDGAEICYDVVDMGEGRYKAVQAGGKGSTSYTVKKLD